MYIKLYNYIIKDTIINNLEKIIDEKILTLFNYLKTKKSCQQCQPQKSHFINDFINKMADIFISHRQYVNYKLALKLRHDRVIITPSDPFE